MVGYANYLIFISKIIKENIRNKRKTVEKLMGGCNYKITNISAADYPSVLHLVSKQCSDIVILPYGRI